MSTNRTNTTIEDSVRIKINRGLLCKTHTELTMVMKPNLSILRNTNLFFYVTCFICSLKPLSRFIVGGKTTKKIKVFLPTGLDTALEFKISSHWNSTLTPSLTPPISRARKPVSETNFRDSTQVQPKASEHAATKGTLNPKPKGTKGIVHRDVNCLWKCYPRRRQKLKAFVVQR